MLEDLIHEAAAAGLDIHDGRTKILGHGYGEIVGAICVEILSRSCEILSRQDGIIYLRKPFSFEGLHDVELRHRIQKA